jgi:acetyl esterase/lipase
VPSREVFCRPWLYIAKALGGVLRSVASTFVAQPLVYSVPMRKLVLAIVAALPALAQTSSTDWAVHAANQYRVIPNVTYLTASSVELKLDVYQRTGVTTPQPTVVYMHGGFWVGGSKEAATMSLMPWLEMGWNVVNVEYRLGRQALAPAAVEDCMCALRFLNNQAKMYNIDPARLVVTGESAGGHLALSLGMIPESAGLDLECAGTPLPRPAAVINWYGITDVADVIDGPHRANNAAQWMGGMPNKMEIAKRVSPLTYVRAGLPPILTIHGDADMTVPYQEAVRLHEALAKAGTPNQLLTIPGGRHGGFTPEERTKIYATIREFLAKNGLGPE